MSRLTTATIIVIAVLILYLTKGLSTEPELRIGKFSAEELTGWQEQTVFNSKKTGYSFIRDNGRIVLQARSVNAAMGLVHKTDIDPRTHPIITWSWKIDHTVKNANERIRDGHDFAARVYVVFKGGIFSRTRAIEYVWGNVMNKGEVVHNPYSKRMVMIAVDAGDELAGKWVSHKRNFAEDYRNAFGEEPPRVRAIAIMTDSDNTHESATGCYGDISVLPLSRNGEQRVREKKNREQPGNGRTVTEPVLPPAPPQPPNSH